MSATERPSPDGQPLPNTGNTSSSTGPEGPQGLPLVDPRSGATHEQRTTSVPTFKPNFSGRDTSAEPLSPRSEARVHDDGSVEAEIVDSTKAGPHWTDRSAPTVSGYIKNGPAYSWGPDKFQSTANPPIYDAVTTDSYEPGHEQTTEPQVVDQKYVGGKPAPKPVRDNPFAAPVPRDPIDPRFGKALLEALGKMKTNLNNTDIPPKQTGPASATKPTAETTGSGTEPEMSGTSFSRRFEKDILPDLIAESGAEDIYKPGDAPTTPDAAIPTETRTPSTPTPEPTPVIPTPLVETPTPETPKPIPTEAPRPTRTAPEHRPPTENRGNSPEWTTTTINPNTRTKPTETKSPKLKSAADKAGDFNSKGSSLKVSSADKITWKRVLSGFGIFLASPIVLPKLLNRIESIESVGKGLIKVSYKKDGNVISYITSDSRSDLINKLRAAFKIG